MWIGAICGAVVGIGPTISPPDVRDDPETMVPASILVLACAVGGMIAGLLLGATRNARAPSARADYGRWIIAMMIGFAVPGAADALKQADAGVLGGWLFLGLATGVSIAVYLRFYRSA